jgi:hypothetical protein
MFNPFCNCGILSFCMGSVMHIISSADCNYWSRSSISSPLWVVYIFKSMGLRRSYSSYWLLKLFCFHFLLWILDVFLLLIGISLSSCVGMTFVAPSLVIRPYLRAIRHLNVEKNCFHHFPAFETPPHTYEKVCYAAFTHFSFVWNLILLFVFLEYAVCMVCIVLHILCNNASFLQLYVIACEKVYINRYNSSTDSYIWIKLDPRVFVLWHSMCLTA